MSDCELPECATHKTVKARVSHVCCECRGIINAGEQYECISGIWDGEPLRFKICTNCYSIREKLISRYKISYDEIGMGELDDALFASDDAELIGEWLANRTNRGVKKTQWMIDYLSELTNKHKTT